MIFLYRCGIRITLAWLEYNTLNDGVVFMFTTNVEASRRKPQLIQCFCIFLWWTTRKITLCLLSRLHVTSIGVAIYLANCLNKWRLSETVIEYLIQTGKSSAVFRGFVRRLNEQLMERLLCHKSLNEEEKLQLLISWFDACVQRQSPETRSALERSVGWLINGIDCSALSTTFVGAVYSRRGSAFAESPACKWVLKWISLLYKLSPFL